MPSELVASMVVTFIVPLAISLVQLVVKGLTDVSLMLASDLSDMFPPFLIILLTTAFAKDLAAECFVISLLVPTVILASFACGHMWNHEEVSEDDSGVWQGLYFMLVFFESVYASNTAQVARHLRSEAIAGLEDYVFGPEIFEDSPPSSAPSPPVPSMPNVEHITEQLMMGIKANWERYTKDMLGPWRKRFHLLIIDSPPTPLGDPSLVRRTPWSMRATIPVEIVSLFLEKDRPTFEQFQKSLKLADDANTFHNFIDESHLVISTHKGFMVMGETGFSTLHYNMLRGALDDDWDDTLPIPTIELLSNVEYKPIDTVVSQPIEEDESSRIFDSSMTRTMDTSSASDSSASDTSSATLVDSPSGNQDAQLIECMFPAKNKDIASPANDSFTTQPTEVSWLDRLDGDTSIEGERPVFILPEGYNSICLSRSDSLGGMSEKPSIGPSNSIGDPFVIPGSNSQPQLLDASLPSTDVSFGSVHEDSAPSKHPSPVVIVSAPDSPTSIPDTESLDGTQSSFVIPSSSDTQLLDISLPSTGSSLDTLKVDSAPILSTDIQLPDTDVILGMDSLLIPSTSGVQLLDMSLPAIDTSFQCLEQRSTLWNHSPISDSFPGLLPDTDALCYHLGQGMDAYSIPSISHIMPLNPPLDVSIDRDAAALAIASISEPQPPDSSLPNPDSVQYTDQQMESLIIPSLSDIQLLDASLPPMDTSVSSAPFDTSSTSDSLVPMSPDCIQHANFLALPSTTGLDRIDAALSKIEACIATLKDPPAIVSTSLPNTDSAPQLDQESHYSFVVPSLSDFQLLDASLPGIDISLDHWECESVSLTPSAAIQQSISLPNTGLTRFSDDSFVIPSMSGIQLISSASLPDMDTSMYYSESGSWDHLSFAIPSSSDLQLLDTSLTGLNVSIAYSEVDSAPKLPLFVDDCMERGEWESHASQTFLVSSSSSDDIGELFLYGTDVGMPADYPVWEEEEYTFTPLELEDDLGDPEDDWSIARVGETSYEEYEEEEVTLIFRLGGSIRSPPV